VAGLLSLAVRRGKAFGFKTAAALCMRCVVMRATQICVFVVGILAGVPSVPLAQDKKAEPAPKADAIREGYKKTLKESPPPKALSKCVLATQKDFRLEAATLEVTGGRARITVVTKEKKLPDDAACLFLCLRQGAKAEGVAKLINDLGKEGLLSELSSDVFTQGVLWRGEAAAPDHMTVFEGTFGAAAKALDPDTLDYDRYVAVQLCRNRPGPVKTASNPLWVKVNVK
jgi:hypothetical protein